MSDTIPHIPAWRFGQAHYSLQESPVYDHRCGTQRYALSQVTPGMVQRDLSRLKTAKRKLSAKTTRHWMTCLASAADIFLHESVVMDPRQDINQSPEEFLEALSQISALPRSLGTRNMEKIASVMRQGPTWFASMTNNMPLDILDPGHEQSWVAQSDALGCILPSNSPGVHGLWVPVVSLKIPLLLKPGSLEPLTPFRLIQCLIKAGFPAEAFGFYPTHHRGTGNILHSLDRVLLFGDKKVTKKFGDSESVQVHGPGYSKIVLDDEAVDNVNSILPQLRDAVGKNGGRSCINTSTIVVTKDGHKVAKALADALAQWQPKSLTDPEAELSPFAMSSIAQWCIDNIEQGLDTPGAELMGQVPLNQRVCKLEGSTFALPCVVYCEDSHHTLAKTEFLFPYCAVVEVPKEDVFDYCGDTLALGLYTNDSQWIEEAKQCRHIERININAPTIKVDWDQPHEGNLFNFLYQRRAYSTPNTKPSDTSQDNTAQAPGGHLHISTRLVTGTNSIQTIGELAKSLFAKRALLVTDKGIVKAGHAEQVSSTLQQAGIQTALYDQVRENPTTEDVNRCVGIAQQHQTDLLIGLGGGSSMDTAKGCNFIYTNGGTMHDYKGKGLAKKPMLPSIMIPTTTGTGSEMQSFALIADEQTHVKMACGDPKAAASISILDPTLTLSQPESILAYTALDALTHILETSVTKAKQFSSDMFSQLGLKHWVNGMTLFETNGKSIACLEQWQLAASYAGIAIEHSMLGAAHACANPLTARFGVVHGHAVICTLLPVMALNKSDPESHTRYATWAQTAGISQSNNTSVACDDLFAFIHRSVEALGLTLGLKQFGVNKTDLASMAKDATEQWTGTFNPVPVTYDTFMTLYKESL